VQGVIEPPYHPLTWLLIIHSFHIFPPPLLNLSLCLPTVQFSKFSKIQFRVERYLGKMCSLYTKLIRHCNEYSLPVCSVFVLKKLVLLMLFYHSFENRLGGKIPYSIHSMIFLNFKFIKKKSCFALNSKQILNYDHKVRFYTFVYFHQGGLFSKSPLFSC
jgi:hypothetical protein